MLGFKEIKEDIKLLFRLDKARDANEVELKRRISELESKELKFKNELGKLNWMLENPNPYKVGQKINGEIITEVWLHWPHGFQAYYDFSKTGWHYKTVKPIK